MAEVKNADEPLLSSKRSPDLSTQDHPNNGPKKQKLDDTNNGREEPTLPQKPCTEDELPQKPMDKAQIVDAEAREQKQQQEQEEDEDDEEDHSDEETVIDRKGKGILIEEEEDEEDDDDTDSGSDSDSDVGNNMSDDSDFADDPLAEVDLDNILPSRTRRKSIQPGAYIANDIPEEDSEESDDPDA